jgi:hypothetical protein
LSSNPLLNEGQTHGVLQSPILLLEKK